MTPLKILLLLTALFLLLDSTPGQAACCSYGCCDCSCVALKAEAKAAKLSRALGRRGSLQSYSINASDQKSAPGPIKCSLEAEVAVCRRQ